ncbi:SigB/SigF/SigG family RNA polymerase sigma factor [Kitasatospora sp. MBT63]|uniref:SigB/SigF/SigG family RNA polymerase sigma factor n=1 Tax=Kitasatospora sp. MBT63 TaxID=1444768 RepID=UPI001E364C8B|nr:SigB/SigF/SigG family RNA polymerase sigma factor [Kitasatospora sp. MBT63]
MRYVASRFRHRTEDMNDIVQSGTVGLIKAIDGYAHRRGVEFLTYAIPTIAGEIKRFFRDTSWPVRVPRTMQELYLAVARGSDRVEQELGRQPTAEELAERLDLTRDQVTEGLVASRVYRTDSLDAPRERDTDDARSALADRLGACDPGLELAEFRAAVRPLLAGLPRRAQKVLALRFWEYRTQSEIAAEMGVSQMQISRILSATFTHLRESIEDRDAPAWADDNGHRPDPMQHSLHRTAPADLE